MTEPAHVRRLPRTWSVTLLGVWFVASAWFVWAAATTHLPPGWPVSGWVEALGIATSVLFAWFEVRESWWNWPVAIVASIAYFEFFRQFGYFANMWLQLYYVAISVLGWYWWLRGGEKKTELPITRATPKVWRVFGLVAVGAVLVAGGLMVLIHRQAGLLDVVTAVLSIGGEVLLGRKILENWWVWILVNALTVLMLLVPKVFVFHLDPVPQLTLDANTAVPFSAGLYGFFLLLSFMGLTAWRRALLASKGSGEPDVSDS